MSPAVLIGSAGVLVAAVATGMLAGRCARRPRIDFIVWTAATLGLTIALAAQSMGFAGGFGPVTFRAIQLFALLLAPLWFAWGLVELVVANEAARFGMRLVSSALTVVASVILATDPLTAEPFSKAWPRTGLHFQPVALYTLGVVQGAAVLVVVVSAGLAAARARSDPRWRPALAAVVPAGLAVLMTAALRFPLPAGAAYPLLSAAAAALVWFGVSRVRERPAARRNGRRDGVREGTGRYRSGTRPGDDYRPGDAYRPEDDYRPGAAYRPDDYRPDDYRPAAAYGPADDHVPEGQYAIYGQRGGPPEPGRPPRTGVVAGAAPTAMNGVDQGWRANPGPQPAMPERPDRYRGSWPGGAPADERWPRTQAPDTLGVLGDRKSVV